MAQYLYEILVSTAGFDEFENSGFTCYIRFGDVHCHSDNFASKNLECVSPEVIEMHLAGFFGF
jgi:hypothetical protein